MVDGPVEANPLYLAWMQGQNLFLEAQQSLWKEYLAKGGALTELGSADSAQDQWQEARKQAEDWISKFAPSENFFGADDGIAQVTLQKMMDPNQFLFAGSDEVNRTIQRLAEGPEFADISTLERQALRSTKEWFALREASAAYRLVAAKAWTTAVARFSESLVKNPEKSKEGPRAILDHWLEISNEELTALQRTSAFLNAQRKLLRSGVDYRICERRMLEDWCEQHSMPTRTEVDELHATVYRLRREMREVKKLLVEMGQSSEHGKAALPRRKNG